MLLMMELMRTEWLSKMKDDVEGQDNAGSGGVPPKMYAFQND